MKTETHNETKHTPGPWRIGDAGTTIFGPPTNEPAPVIIALNLKPTERVGYHERKANTRLIAAAPELLKACKAVVAWASAPGDHGGNPYCKEFVRLAQEAVNKADCRRDY